MAGIEGRVAVVTGASRGIGEAIRLAGMRRSLVNLAALRDHAGAVAENGTLSPLLAAIAVIHVDGKSGAISPDTRYVPATDDFVQGAIL